MRPALVARAELERVRKPVSATPQIGPVPAESTAEQLLVLEQVASPASRAGAKAHAAAAPVTAAGWLYVLIVSVWLAGMLGLVGWLLLCHAAMLRLRARSAPVAEGEAAELLRSLCARIGIRAPLLLASPRVRSPFLIALGTPAILLPASYQGEFGRDALRAVLAHELAHLVRADAWWNLLGRLACAVGWMQPLLWSLCRRLEHAGEEICDEAVVAQQCSPRDYADCLIALAERLVPYPERLAGVGVVPFRSSLSRRVRYIMALGRGPTPTISVGLRAGILIGTACLAGLSLVAVAAPVQPGGSASPPGAGAAEAAIAPSLRGDARLQAKVTLAFKNQPLEAALADVAQKTGVRLVADRSTGDDKVTLFLDERPAAEALTLIARQFDFQWQRNRGGYELTQDIAGRNREAALRDRDRATEIGAILARMARLTQMAGTPAAQLQSRQSEIAKRLAALDVPADERARLTEEQQAIRDLLRPGGAASAAIFGALSPAQLAQLRAGGEIRLSTTDGTLPPRMVPGIQQAVEQMRQPLSGMGERMVFGITQRIGGPPGVAPVPGAEADRAAGDGPPVHAANVTIGFTNAGALRSALPRRGGPQPQLRFTLTSVEGTASTRRLMPVNWSPMMVPPEEKTVAPVTQTEDPVLQRPVDLALPGAKTPPAGGPNPTPGLPVIVIGSGRWPADMPALADVSEAIHRVTGLEVLADSFIRARLNAGAVSGKRPLVQVLDEIANELQYDWKKEGNLLRFRSRIYYQDRAAEVPERILRPWAQRVGRAGAPTLDDMAELAASLSDPQCRGLQEFWGWYLEKTGVPALPGIAGFADNRHHLRFWATLTPVQRRDVLGGAVLPLERMNGFQRQAFQTALTAPNEGGMVRIEADRRPTPAEMAAGGFSLETQQLSQQINIGTGADGRQMAMITMGPAGGPGPAPRMQLPEGVPLQPSGPPTLLDSFMFRYHVGGEPMPARTASIQLPRPQNKR